MSFYKDLNMINVLRYMINMEITHETTFNSLGSAIQMGIMKKYPDQASELIKNPRIKIVITL